MESFTNLISKISNDQKLGKLEGKNVRGRRFEASMRIVNKNETSELVKVSHF